MLLSVGGGASAAKGLGLSLLAPQPLIGGAGSACAVAGFLRGAQAFQRETERHRVQFRRDGLHLVR